ncbi:uncharacterized protein [Watersipora subatra]|uniref:uncharacterized protein n=1 Tax=Watersipora subatra TaxID=2589382 RepID=UPI00355C8FD8
MDKGPSHFNPDGEASAVSAAWAQWIEEFEAFSDSRGIFHLPGDERKDMRAQRKALLLFHAGPRVRVISKNLAESARDDYERFKKALADHFTVEPNITFQRHLFRRHSQAVGESVSQYCARLRKAGSSCGYNDLNEQIRDHIVETCTSDLLRRKLLEQGNDLSLTNLLRIAATHEAVDARSTEMSGNVAVNRTKSDLSGYNRQGQSDPSGSVTAEADKHGTIGNRICGRCGTTHKIRECPAFGKQCFKCHGKNHFRFMCKSSAHSANAVVERGFLANLNISGRPLDSELAFSF